MTYPWQNGTPTLSRDATANDSAKTVLTVPTGKFAVVNAIHAEIVTTATVGNRFLGCRIGNGVNTIWVSPVTAAIAASKSGTLNLGLFHAFSTTVQYNPILAGTYPDISVCGPIPYMVLPEGYTVEVWDTAAVDAAADDMTTIIEYILYDA